MSVVKKKSASKGAKRAKPAKATRKQSVVKAKAGSAKRAGAKKAVAKKSTGKKLVAKKPSGGKVRPKVNAKAKPAKPATATVRRRDGTGHLDPKYAAELRALVDRPKDDDRAFPSDALSQELGEEFVETVTSGEDEGTEIRDKRVTEELGGPFTVTSGGTEFASGVDPSNPKRSTREPFPRT
jgi:hypothetical protein